MISLVMLSGGIDSAYALHKVLTETDDEVLVHHVHIKTNAGRYIPEARACERIVAYCRKNIRPFHYSESTIDHRRFVAEGYDIYAVALEAGMVAGSFYFSVREKRSVDRWIYGLSADDVVAERRLTRAREIARHNAMIDKKPDLFMFPRVPLSEQIKSLPRDIYDMTWSCRFPRNLPSEPVTCGKCVSCERRRLALDDLKVSA